jgi:hypothetical protein
VTTQERGCSIPEATLGKLQFSLTTKGQRTYNRRSSAGSTSLTLQGSLQRDCITIRSSCAPRTEVRAIITCQILASTTVKTKRIFREISTARITITVHSVSESHLA